MNEQYAWVAWFRDLVGKIATGGEEQLIKRAKQVDWARNSSIPPLLRYGDKNIDPFSFLYFLGQTFDENRRDTVHASISRVFGIEIREIFFEEGSVASFPYIKSAQLSLFHAGKNGNPGLLWKLFRQATAGLEAINAQNFAEALTIKNVGVAKLTHGLFFINPNDFFPIIQATLENHGELNLPSIKEARKQIKDEFNGLKNYKEILKQFQDAYPGRSFYEINAELMGNKSSTSKKKKTSKKTPKDDKLMKNSPPLNQILFGPPGTGKTWHAVNHALAIIEDKSVEVLKKEDRDLVKQRFDELKESGQIEMVTFHQNFAYEDFIEGIRPVLDDGSDDSNNVHYEIVAGIFKRISNLAKENLTGSSQETEPFDLEALLHDFAQHINQKIEQGETIMLAEGTKSPNQITGATISESGKIHFHIKIEKSNRNYSLSAYTIRQNYTKFINEEIKTYQDIKPRHKSKSRYHGLALPSFHIMKHIKTYQDTEWDTVKQETEEKQNYVLIIDEINRGNIAKIFGELITLIEESKRIGNEDETTVTLPYSSNSEDEEDSFGVPNNLYIIGTMNTADRSIALLDTALRRRFDFIEMMPEPEHEKISTDIDGVNCQTLLATMNKRITALLDREHQIGHSYFIGVNSIEELSSVFKNKIIPLLQEYFYDDWEKIELVLNKNKFVTATKIESALFSDTELVDTERLIYELIDADDHKWTSIDSYTQIYASKQRRADDDE